MPYTKSKAQVAKGTVVSIGTQAGFPSGTTAFAVGETFIKIGEVISFKINGSKKDTVDVTNFDSIGSYKEKLDTLLDWGSVEIMVNRVSSDAGQQALITAFTTPGAFDFKVQFPLASGQSTTGDLVEFQALVVSGGDYELTHDKQVTISFKLEITGPVYTVAGS